MIKANYLLLCPGVISPCSALPVCHLKSVHMRLRLVDVTASLNRRWCMLYYERVARNAITGADAFMPIQLRLSESKNHFLCMHAHIASMVSSRHY